MAVATPLKISVGLSGDTFSAEGDAKDVTSTFQLWLASRMSAGDVKDAAKMLQETAGKIGQASDAIDSAEKKLGTVGT